MHPILAVQDVAELLQCEVTTVQELLRRGELPGLKFGRAWIVPSEPLLQYLNQMAMAEAIQRRNDRETVRPTAVFVGNPKQKREPPKLPNL